MTAKINPYEPGDFVRYIHKNEIGLVGEIIDGERVRVWWHRGGTKATAPLHILEPIDDSEVFTTEFSNDYAKLSLIERRRRLFEGGDVSDLIDI